MGLAHRHRAQDALGLGLGALGMLTGHLPKAALALFNSIVDFLSQPFILGANQGIDHAIEPPLLAHEIVFDLAPPGFLFKFLQAHGPNREFFQPFEGEVIFRHPVLEIFVRNEAILGAEIVDGLLALFGGAVDVADRPVNN